MTQIADLSVKTGSFYDKTRQAAGALTLLYLIKPALSKLNRGGNLILAPVTMDKPISLGDYDNFWGKGIRSLIHFTRKDGKEFLKKAEEIKIKTKTQIFNFNQIPEALILYDSGKVKGTPVIKVV